MAEILSLREVFRKEGMQFVNRLFDGFVIISEKLNATRFCVQRTEDGTLEFYKKDGKITKIDRALTKLYEQPIKYFESLPKDVLDKLLVGYRYGFRYFHDSRPAMINYDKLPLNGLVLTDILRVKESKTIDDLSILNKISDLLRVEKPPIIWYGELDGSQKTRLLEYLRTPEEQLMSRFKTQSFTKYIISILNPKLKSTILKDDLEKPIDSIIFKFLIDDGKEKVYAKAVDPMITQINRVAEAEREPQDLYGIILSDIVEFIKLNGLKKYTISKTTNDERYVELICSLFNDYMKKMSYRYEGIEINPLDFAKAPQFEMNTGLIEDLTTREYLGKSSINRHIFKIMMGAFNKPKKKPNGTVTQMLIDDVSEITATIKEKIGKTEVKEASSFLTFEEFFIKKQDSSRIIPD
jgi:hypothetical protein